MQRFALMGLALAGLFFLAPDVRATDTVAEPVAFKPAALVRLKPLDGLIGDVKYLVKHTQREEIGKQVEGILKGLTGEKGLAGLDMKKPIGIYATLDKKLDQSQVVLLVPVADEKAFLEFLGNLDFKVEKGEGGLHTLTIENVPFPILFRFANGYAYATPKFSGATTLAESAKLPKPDAVLGKDDGTLTLTANLDRIPVQIRKIAVSAAALQLGNLKDEEIKGETEAQKELRGALLDELTAVVKMLIEEGGPVSLKLDIDQKSHDLSLALETAGKPDTKLAKNLAALGKANGLSGLIGKDSALGGFLNVALPADVVKQLAPVVDESFKKVLDSMDENVRKLAEPIVKSLDGTAKSGAFDVAVDLRGPSKNDKYTFVAGVKVKEGGKIEEAIKKAVGQLPEESKKVFELDADKVEGVNIHRIAQTNVDENTKELLGDGPLFVAITKETVLISAGEDALETLKSALKTRPEAKGLTQLEVSLARLAPVIAKQRKNAVESAKAAFKDKDSDKVTLRVTSGDSLKVEVRVKTAVLTFAALLDAADKPDAEE